MLSERLEGTGTPHMCSKRGRKDLRELQLKAWVARFV